MTDFREADKAATGKDRWEEAWEEWWTIDRVDAVGWALILLWGAAVVVAHETGFGDDISWWEPWGVFFFGTGVIVLSEAVLRLFTPHYRSKFGWTLFWGSVGLSIGLGGLAHEAWYALPLATVAVLILRGAFADER